MLQMCIDSSRQVKSEQPFEIKARISSLNLHYSDNWGTVARQPTLPRFFISYTGFAEGLGLTTVQALSTITAIQASLLPVS